jgi:hypothetical protein
MADDLRTKALELANSHPAGPNGASHEAVVARATAYHSFLIGAAAPKGATTGATTGAATNKATTAGATAGKGTGGAAAGAAASKATTATQKPAQQKQVGQYTADQVKEKMRAVLQAPGLGRTRVIEILDEEAGAKTFGDIKPDKYDAVYEAFEVALNSGEGDKDKSTGVEDPDLGV